MLKLYSTIERHDTLIDYDLNKVPFGHGSLDSRIEETVKSISELLDEAKNELS